MRKTVLFLAITLCACIQNDQNAVDKFRMLSGSFSKYENFFPIVTLDATDKGVKEDIHIIYVYFDARVDLSKSFPHNENINCYSFRILKNGSYRPTFEKSALDISSSFRPYFTKECRKFKNKKASWNIAFYLEMPDKPEWLQHDQTPMNSKGKPMIFICQMDMIHVIRDNCRLFVFYDKEDRIVKNICQRH